MRECKEKGIGVDQSNGTGLLRVLLASADKQNVIESLSGRTVSHKEGLQAWESMASARTGLPELPYFVFDESMVWANGSSLRFARYEYAEAPADEARDALLAYIAVWHTALGYRYADEWSSELAFLVWSTARMGEQPLIELLQAIRFFRSVWVDRAASIHFALAQSCASRALGNMYWSEAEATRVHACAADIESFEHVGVGPGIDAVWQRVLDSVANLDMSYESMLQYLGGPRDAP